jgi:xylulose-5-phosphate/fructose-6-phosphate phosphoketolase
MDLRPVHRWWSAANYLSVGQLYLRDNPMLREPLQHQHVKSRLLGHWGTVPGLNLLWAHVNRWLQVRPRPTLFVCGPGHGAPAVYANAWLEGSFTRCYPGVGRDTAGMAELFRRFSAPYGLPSHAAPDAPGSIHEGGELGYSLAHAQGAVLDAPGEQVVCVIGDGEAETGALAASWLGGRFLSPRTDGVVLPVLHLNGYKIANPTVLARMAEADLRDLLRGFGYDPTFVEGHEPDAVHEALAAALDGVGQRLDELAEASECPRGAGKGGGRGDGRAPGGPDGGSGARWPMIVLRTPKGWTGPRVVDGLPVEGHFRSHQIPLADPAGDPAQLAMLEGWLRSYRPDELFGADGAPAPDVLALVPDAVAPLSAAPRANAGADLTPLRLPPVEPHAVAVPRPGAMSSGSTAVLGAWLADVAAANRGRFRLFGPDEVQSNRLGAVLEVTDRQWPLPMTATDVGLGPTGQVLEVLSEHLCQGWLEGYLLTGRHGLFTCYEAFVHIVDSMFNQHAKWLEASSRVPWRRDIASLTYLLTSHVWRQDHNGFSHQDPGFLDVVGNKRPGLVRVFLPPDANTLLAVGEWCLASLGRINVIVAGKQSAPQYLGLPAARLHCARGGGIWPWAGNEAQRGEPDVVLACAGDVPTMEAIAAARLLDELTELSVRVVNIVDLFALQGADVNPDGLDDATFDSLFTTDRPVVFAFHGYPWLIHRLVYKRTNHDNIHVRGYIEEGSTTTPFDMVVRNRLDRYHLALEAIDRQPRSSSRSAAARQDLLDRLAAQDRRVRQDGLDLDEVTEWQAVPS